MSRRGRSRAVGVTVWAAAAVLLAGARSVHAQAACNEAPAAARRWASPLDRLISLRSRDLPLRDVLDRLAAAAHIRLSYTAELLPLDRRVCVSYDAVPAGDALAGLLEGTHVAPVVSGREQVVLAPSAQRTPGAAPPVRQPSVGQLDRVVVTGTVNGTPERAVPVALDVVSGRQVAERGTGTMSSVLDGAVPGIWLWDQSPSSMLARYGSIRGASSFGVSYPKIYIDGIEVANPLLLTQIDPQSIERVETIRGPQGAALSGADAISGVINIITRHDGTADGVPHAQLRTVAGTAGSDFGAGGVLTQSHALALRTGSATRSAGLALSLGTIGDYIPGGDARQFLSTGDLRLVGSRTMVNGTVRFFAQDAGVPSNPLLADIVTQGGLGTRTPMGPSTFGRQRGARPAMSGQGATAPVDSSGMHEPPFDSSSTQSVRQYTVGGTATFEQNARWTHTAVVGVDGYRLRDASGLGIPFPSAADSALRAARGGADRGTFRLSSVAHFGETERRSTTITLAAEHSTVREQSESEAPYAPPSQGTIVDSDDAVTWRSNTGFIAQASSAWNDALFLTAGVRFERSAGISQLRQFATLPMLGASWVQAAGDVTLKLRTAYGRGVRPARTSSRSTTWLGIRESVPNALLGPEKQSGYEAGADLLFGRRLSLHLTRFDQLASGLIQPVAVATSQADTTTWERRIAYQLQNVGEITNRGWEMQGALAAGSLSLAGTMSLVESRVRQLAPGYSGDLQPGDRMLEVPARTTSLTATWSSSRWLMAWTVTRAADWINYDRLALAEALAGPGFPARATPGGLLRTFWREYDGVTRLRVNATRSLVGGMSLVLAGDNLLGKQLGEPDNVTVVPGRTLTAGLRLRF
jgi:iron complex outermembrane recepter protein